VDGSNKHPINDPTTAELLSLRAQIAQARASQAPPEQDVQKETSQVFRIQFDIGGTTFKVPWAHQTSLLALIRQAQHIEVRGRTDAQITSNKDEQVALARAISARRFLVQNGVTPSKIGLNFVSGGDFVADNDTEEGRAKNRRVEIEVWR
jgi:outer membrane protein OmpA-like peptidoglycan-associated protein